MFDALESKFKNTDQVWFFILFPFKLPCSILLSIIWLVMRLLTIQCVEKSSYPSSKQSKGSTISQPY